MRRTRFGLTIAGLAALWLTACGGGGGSGSSSSGGNQNFGPTANAGTAQTVTSGSLVTLDGSASSDTDGTIASYAWAQTAGNNVNLSNSTVVRPTFIAPTVVTATAFTFSLVVTDNRNAVSSASTVTITVTPAPPDEVTVTGRIRYARPGFATVFPFGLSYSAPQFLPARGVIVNAMAPGTATVLATATTDSSGNYTMTVPGNADIQIRAVARLLREAPQPLPRWNVRVQDGISATNPYSYTDPAVQIANAGTPRNVDIPLGINAQGQANGTRASGPFAALDTIYESMQLILSANATIDFPALIVDWGAQADGTFFSGGNPQRIALLSDLASDTDEFDEHVVAHEFGHYVEHNFSRSDSIGGPHAVGEKLDIRVAFGEGFGYAFAAMVLDNPNARDSFVDNGTLMSGGFNIEDNPPAPNDPNGCWCSESSVWAILYDIFDVDQDSGDTVALGFEPIWNVLVGEQADTPAFTSIFTFITALKAAEPASVTGINALLTAQNIATNTNAFATTETHQPIAPPTIASSSVFPLYTTINDTGTVTLRTTNDAGTSNKLGNHRYVRFENTTTRDVTITVATSNSDTNADPDFLMWRAGAFVRAGTQPPPGPEVLTINGLQAGTYVIDVYDCGNGCSPAEGASGDYDLTVTIN